MCNIKWEIQKVNLDSKFRSFLVWILIQKDNKDNKVFEKEFYTRKNKKERDRKDKVLQIIVQFAGTYLRKCLGNKVL